MATRQGSEIHYGTERHRRGTSRGSRRCSTMMGTRRWLIAYPEMPGLPPRENAMVHTPRSLGWSIHAHPNASRKRAGGRMPAGEHDYRAAIAHYGAKPCVLSERPEDHQMWTDRDHGRNRACSNQFMSDDIE